MTHFSNLKIRNQVNQSNLKNLKAANIFYISKIFLCLFYIRLNFKNVTNLSICSFQVHFCFTFQKTTFFLSLATHQHGTTFRSGQKTYKKARKRLNVTSSFMKKVWNTNRFLDTRSRVSKTQTLWRKNKKKLFNHLRLFFLRSLSVVCPIECMIEKK